MAFPIRSGSVPLLGLVLLAGAGCQPAPGARFSPTTGVLSIYGTTVADLIVVSVSAGAIVVNGGEMPISGGVPAVANTQRIEVRGREGSDYIELDESGGPLPDGVLYGGDGDDILIGGSGDDRVEGGAGNDVALLGGGDDTFVWTAGGGLDTVEGGEGSDTLRFEGQDVGEHASVVANGARVTFSDDVGNVSTDLGGVEAIEFLARGGADDVTVNDLTGTELALVTIDLAGAQGIGDGAADTLTVNGTQGADSITMRDDGGAIAIGGTLHPAIRIQGQEPEDLLTVNALAGDDSIDATGPDLGIQIVLNLGLGTDTVLGSDGPERVTGGDGNDFVYLGGGDDTFVWNPGDDNDVVVGDEGFDTLIFNGAAVGEQFDLSAVLGHVRLTRSIASVVMDLDDVEAIELPVRSGSDLVTVNDLSTTDLVELDVDLLGNGGVADGAVDSVVVNGTAAEDVVEVSGNASEVTVSGLATQVNILNPESGFDSLTVQTLAGDDVVQASNLTAPSINLTEDGGADDDVLIGGSGADVLLGGTGDDVLQGGPGQDVLDGGPGSNILIQ